MVNVIRQTALLFSKVDSNKLWHDVQSEENVICAKFGKDLFNISKVIGRKKVAQFFWLTVYIKQIQLFLGCRSPQGNNLLRGAYQKNKVKHKK